MSNNQNEPSVSSSGSYVYQNVTVNIVAQDRSWENVELPAIPRRGEIFEWDGEHGSGPWEVTRVVYAAGGDLGPEAYVHVVPTDPSYDRYT